MRKALWIPVVLLLAAQTLWAQEAQPVPSLEQILGYPLGERLTDDMALQGVLDQLARSSPRVKLFESGRTFEGRKMQYLVITSEQNHAALDSIRQGLHRLSFPRDLAPEEAEKLTASLPVAVWLSYSVHGNEHSGTEASMAVAHRLAFANDPQTLDWLKNAVILIDPCQNPDGRARFVQNFRAFSLRQPSADPLAMERGPAWGSPRTNHFYFDLNRDWFILSQPESLARAQAFAQWPGQVFGDFHEMESTSSYFFFPPTEAIHTTFGPETRALWKGFGQTLAAAFDAKRLPYYTAEFFDAFYPGYGDTWPSLQGAIGMTFEQSSARGLLAERDDKTQLRYIDAIDGHVTASFATVEHAVTHRQELLNYTYRFHREAMNAEFTGQARTIFFPAGQDSLRLENLVHTLRAQGIEIFRLTESVILQRGRASMGEETVVTEIPAGSLAIPLQQPRRRLIQVLFERDPKLTDEFLREEREKLLRADGSGFYDITAWSLPLTLGLKTVDSDEEVALKLEPVIAPAAEAEAILEADPYALLLPWSSRAPRVLYELERLKVPVRMATREFKLEGREYRPGTFVILAQRAPELAKALESMDPEAKRELIAVRTGSTEQGPDLGSDSVVALEIPRIAVLGDEPTDDTSYGALAYLFDHRYRIPFTPLRVGVLGWADLSRYDVLILPDSSSGQLVTTLTPIKDQLAAWMRSGGVLVAIGGAATALASEELGLTEVRALAADEASEAASSESAKDEKTEDPNAPASEEAAALPEKPRWPIQTPGALLLAEVDSRHFLGFGLPKEIAVLWSGDSALAAHADRHDPIRLVASGKRLRVSGHVWDEAVEKLQGTPYVVDVPVGHGHAILFVQNPEFRALLWQAQQILLNAVLLAPSL